MVLLGAMTVLSAEEGRDAGMPVRWRFALDLAEFVPELLLLDGALVDIVFHTVFLNLGDNVNSSNTRV